MLVGYNHNIVYKGETYHIQTEDSGVKNPHIITLLYRGGNIFSSKKTSYADIVTSENLEQVVEDLMKEQHKDMMRRLKAGDFDSRLGLTGASSTPVPAEPAQAKPVPPQAAPPLPPAAPQQTPSPAAPQQTPSPAAPVQTPQQAAVPSPASPESPFAIPVEQPAKPKPQSLDDIIFDFLNAGDKK